MGLVTLEMEIGTPNILFLKNQKDQIKRERLWENATDRTSMTKRKIIKYPAAWKEKQKRFKEATKYDITVQYPNKPKNIFCFHHSLPIKTSFETLIVTS